MAGAMTANEILDRLFLEMRARILELAASFDRIDRADSDDHLGEDPRPSQLRRANDIVNSGRYDRAEQVQMIFSDPYQAGWNRPD